MLVVAKFVGHIFCLYRNEIESQIQQVDREIQQCHDQFGPGIEPPMSYGVYIIAVICTCNSMCVFYRVPS